MNGLGGFKDPDLTCECFPKAVAQTRESKCPEDPVLHTE